MGDNNKYEKPLFFQLQYWITLIYSEISSTDPYKPNPYKPSCVYSHTVTKVLKILPQIFPQAQNTFFTCRRWFSTGYSIGRWGESKDMLKAYAGYDVKTFCYQE